MEEKNRAPQTSANPKSLSSIEELLLEEMRRLGSETMTEWAAQAEQRMGEELKQQDRTCSSTKKTLSWSCIFGAVVVSEQVWSSVRVSLICARWPHDWASRPAANPAGCNECSRTLVANTPLPGRAKASKNIMGLNSVPVRSEKQPWPMVESVESSHNPAQRLGSQRLPHQVFPQVHSAGNQKESAIPVVYVPKLMDTCCRLNGVERRLKRTILEVHLALRCKCSSYLL
jgi:hypothetical protein